MPTHRGQGERERRALARSGARGGERSAVVGDDRAGDGQAEAAAGPVGAGPGLVDPVEPLEDRPDLVGRDAVPVVGSP